MIMNCPVELPDETMVMSNNNDNNVLHETYRSMADDKRVNADTGVTDASRIPVKICDSSRTTDRLQECVGNATIYGRPNNLMRTPKAFQVYPGLTTRRKKTRSGPLTWGRTSQLIAAK
jgi:hypothetical protein